MNTYRVEFEDNEMEIITEDSNDEAIQQAFKMESEHGTVLNVTLLDDNYDDVETIF